MPIRKRETTSIKIDPEIWKLVKIHCIGKNIEISDYLEGIIKKDLSKQKSIREINNDLKVEIWGEGMRD